MKSYDGTGAQNLQMRRQSESSCCSAKRLLLPLLAYKFLRHSLLAVLACKNSLKNHLEAFSACPHRVCATRANQSRLIALFFLDPSLHAVSFNTTKRTPLHLILTLPFEQIFHIPFPNTRTQRNSCAYDWAPFSLHVPGMYCTY